MRKSAISDQDRPFGAGGLKDNMTFSVRGSGYGLSYISRYRYITAMCRTLFVTLMALALALGALSSSANSAARSMQGDCCDEMCHDIPACANMILCQVCSPTVAPLPTAEFFVSDYQSAFPPPDQERVYKSAAWPIWTPPD